MSDATENRLHDYLDRRMSAEDRGAFEQQLADDPALAARVEELRAIGKALREDAPDLSPGFYTRARARFESERAAPGRQRFRPFSWEIAGLAAAAVLALVIFLPPVFDDELQFGAPEPAPSQERLQKMLTGAHLDAVGEAKEPEPDASVQPAGSAATLPEPAVEAKKNAALKRKLQEAPDEERARRAEQDKNEPVDAELLEDEDAGPLESLGYVAADRVDRPEQQPATLEKGYDAFTERLPDTPPPAKEEAQRGVDVDREGDLQPTAEPASGREMAELENRRQADRTSRLVTVGGKATLQSAATGPQVLNGSPLLRQIVAPGDVLVIETDEEWAAIVQALAESDVRTTYRYSTMRPVLIGSRSFPVDCRALPVIAGDQYEILLRPAAPPEDGSLHGCVVWLPRDGRPVRVVEVP